MSIRSRLEKIEARCLPKETHEPVRELEDSILFCEAAVTQYRDYFGEPIPEPPAGATMSELERHWGGQFATIMTALKLSEIHADVDVEDGEPRRITRVDEMRASGNPVLEYVASLFESPK